MIEALDDDQPAGAVARVRDAIEQWRELCFDPDALERWWCGEGSEEFRGSTTTRVRVERSGTIYSEFDPIAGF